MPEAMKKLTVIGLKNSGLEVLEGLGELGVLHLKRVEEPEFFGLKPEALKNRPEYEDLFARFTRLRERLGVEAVPETEKAVEMSEKELKSCIESYEGRIDRLLSELEDAKKTLSKLEEEKRRLELLRDNGVPVGELGRTHDKFVKAGLISGELAPRLEKYFSSLPYLTYRITSVSSFDDFILLRGIGEVEEWVLNVLRLFNFREFTFPPSTPRETDEALTELDEELIRIGSEVDRLEGERNELKQEFMEKLSSVGLHLRNYIRLSEAQSYILGSENLSVFQGWIPTSRIPNVKRLFENMDAERKNSVTFTIEEPNQDEEPPTLITTPTIIKPFSILTRMLGIPNYQEIDPTVISTVLWVAMFGIMFPDVGQGILILVLGAILAFIVKKSFFGLNLRTVGKLWIGLGVSAAFFGALFGEVFLVEGLIPPLWLSPLEGRNVWLLLKVAIFFGVAQIFLGLTFGLINSIKRGDVVEALIGEHSVASIGLFGGLLTLIIRFWTIRSLSAFAHWTTMIPLVSLVAILMKSTVKRRFGGVREGGVMEDFGSAIEMFISLLSNTVSYARLAGFCLAHVALAKVCQILLMKSATLGFTGLVLMNFLALTLELLIVMIQALRLLYYEFSTKFYLGTGIEYKPLILEKT